MKPDVKRMWVEALRSDEFKQGRGFLNRPNEGMCCLGVLCELHRRETGHGQWVSELNYGFLRYTTEGHARGEQHYPPAEVIEWAGLTPHADGAVPGNVSVLRPPEPLISAHHIYEDAEGRINLSDFNDEGFTFAEIAAIIDEVL